MPWMIVDEDGKSCIHKKNEDGSAGELVKCHDSKADAEAHLKALYANVEDARMVRSPVRDLVISRKALGDYRLEVLGVPFGGPLDGKDADGEFFSERTDIVMGFGESRPVFFAHGDGQDDPPVIGKATYVRKDDKGHWFEVVLDKTNDFARRVYEAAVAGIAKASSGSIRHLVRGIRQTGELLKWPFAELTLLDKTNAHLASNQYAIATLKMGFERAGLTMPETFAGTEARADEARAKVSADAGARTIRVEPEYLVEARQLLRQGEQRGSQ